MLSKKYIVYPLLVVVCAIITNEYFRINGKTNPDAGLNIEKLVPKYKYPLEIHHVETEDGYILRIHRIPHGIKSKSNNETKIPVLIMHGLTGSSSNYINMGPSSSLGYILADKGYDVWLPNSRGNMFSRKHSSLDPDKDRDFWRFTFHEIGNYDLPAVIDYILSKTKMSNLHYVGLSQGATVSFILMNEKPQYSSKIRLVSAMAPAVLYGHTRSPVMKILVTFRRFFAGLYSLIDRHEMFPHNGLVHNYLRYVCDENSIFLNLCYLTTFMLFGFNKEHVNTTSLSVIYGNSPSGISAYQIDHFLGNMEAGDFYKYDHGFFLNINKYNSDQPPKYDLSKVTVPVALYYAANDWLVDVEDVKKLKAQLPNVVKHHLIPSENFNHHDFLYSKEVNNLVYKTLIAELGKY